MLLKAIDNIKKRFPDVEIVGHHHGFFNWDAPTVISEIINTQPDLVFVVGISKTRKVDT